MALVKFEFHKSTSSLNILGSEFNLNSLKTLLSIIQEVENDNDIKEFNIIGNFNTKLLTTDIFNNINNNDLDNILLLFQSVTEAIENSRLIFTSFIKGNIQGPAMEIALSCNYIKADRETKINFDDEFIPFFGTIQRLNRLLGYKKALQTLLIDKTINFIDASGLQVINNEKDNTVKIKSKNLFWDQSFTNTFIFFNSKIHSIYKNKKPSYNAILSIIYEGSICQYKEAISIEKRWLKWLIIHRLKNLQ